MISNIGPHNISVLNIFAKNTHCKKLLFTDDCAMAVAEILMKSDGNEK